MNETVGCMPSRVCVPRSKGNTTTGQFGLPTDVMERAVVRLGWLGLIYAATINAVHWTRMYTLPPSLVTEMPMLALIGLIVGSILGLTICAMSWSRRVPVQMMLDIGLIFEVAAAFCIAVMENANPLLSAGFVRGVSGLALWTAFFVLVVPSSFGKATLAALASTAMGPLGLLLYSGVYRNDVPSAGIWASLFIPDIICTIWAVVLSRFIYGIGRDLGQARRMGYYELIEPLGRGGMGEVWRAKHRMLARPAAIKLISPEAGLTTTMVKRFEQEAQMTATLQSQHTIQLYDFGVTDDGAFYYVMEYLNGLDLETLVEKYGPLPAERTVNFLLQIADSLEEAHQVGLVHRDIKPANIFTSIHGVQHDLVKVLDFGLAEFSENHKKLTMTGGAGGTPAFMAPEAALGKTVNARTDIYALGAVGYWLLTGRLVFEAETPYATVMEHIYKTPVPPSRRTEIEIPESLERIIMMCLEKDPANRPGSARELAAMLRKVELPAEWDEARAMRWWQMHRPAATGRRPVLEIQKPMPVEVA
jgi:eukaryotic-like serine/threonine-protein kinase